MQEHIETLKKQGIPPRTVKLLALIWPFPVGEAMKIEEAAKELGISAPTAYKRLDRLKKTCPIAYAKFRHERKIQREIGQFLHVQAYFNDKNDKMRLLTPEARKVLRENLRIKGEKTDEKGI